MGGNLQIKDLKAVNLQIKWIYIYRLEQFCSL